MNDFIERLKTDRILQIIVGGFLLISLILFYIFKSALFPKKEKIPCYNEIIKIWFPFREDEVYPYLSPFTRFCVQFKITTKSLEEIKRDLVYSLAKGDFPDLVFIDNDFLNQNKDLFSTSTPIFIDSLIAFYNQDILNFLNLPKQKTLDELKNFISSIKSYRKDFYPLALGTKEIRNRKEIILSLMSLQDDYKDKQKFIQNFLSALKIYLSFSDVQSEFFSYPEGAGDDLLNFANQKSALYIGFYQDKKEILNINPRINLSYGILPLNTFPPKAKIYTKIFYLAQVKKSRSKASQEFVKWFLNYKLKKFSQDFDLIPFYEYPDLSEDQKVVFDSFKNFGENFDFLNKEKLFDNIDRILEASKNEGELYKILQEIQYSL
jgi:ABC-type glycerol-3-phosphate transport system substrate-binding protein